MNGSAEWDNSSQVWPKDKLTWIGVLQGQSFFIPGNLLRAKYFLSIFPGFPDVLQHSRSSNHNVCRWVYAHCETSNSIKMSTVTDLIQTYWTCVSLLCLDILGLLQLEEKKKKKGIGHVGFLDLFAFLDLMLSGHVGLSEVLYIAYSHIILSRKFKQNFGLVADSHVVSMFFCGQ